jgi:hypothetical protein
VADDGASTITLSVDETGGLRVAGAEALDRVATLRFTAAGLEVSAAAAAPIVLAWDRYGDIATALDGPARDGWLIVNAGGRYGDRFHIRAARNLVGIWANDAREVVYYVGTRDRAGAPYRGGIAYALTFAPDALPSAQADAYWSVILVDVPEFRVIANPIERYNLNSHSPLQPEPDGGLRIDIAPAPIAGRPDSNWLPSPAEGLFSLTLRLYVPKEAALTGDWCPPPLTPLGEQYAPTTHALRR